MRTVLTLILGMLSIPPVLAAEYVNPLPSNTILFDDFESTTLKWFQQDHTGNGILARNTTRAYDGSASAWIRADDTTANLGEDGRRTFSHPSDIVGFTVFFTFSKNLETQGSTAQGVGASLEYWDGTYRKEFKVSYRPRASNDWTYFHDNGSSQQRFQSGVNYRPYDDTGRARETWSFVKIVGNRATGKYVSVTTPEGTYRCGVELADCDVDVDATESLAGTLFKWWGIEIQLTIAGAVCSSCAAHFDNALVTDESGTVSPVPAALLQGILWPWPLAAFILAPIVWVIRKANNVKGADEKIVWMKRGLKLAIALFLIVTVYFAVFTFSR